MTRHIAIFGVLTVTLLTGCGGGDLPNMDTTVTAANVSANVDQTTPDPLELQPTAYTITVGGTSALNARGGTGNYIYSLDSTSFATISGNIITGVAVGTITARVNDGVSSRQISLVVAAATVVSQQPTMVNTKMISINGGQSTRVLADYVSGSVPVYRCNNAGPSTVIFSVSTAGNCIGATVLGYVYSSQIAGTVPVYQFSHGFTTGNAISGGLGIWTTYDLGASAASAIWQSPIRLGFAPPQ